MRGRSASVVDRYLPVGYFAVAVALVAALLPSALRPPQAPPPESAALNPDTPPDDQILLTELQRGSSGTAGSGTPGDAAIGEGIGELPTAPRAPRKGRCWGNPPRQTESLYSPPCAAAFVGDNGGATWKGVGPNEVRVAVVPYGVPSCFQCTGATREIGDQPRSGENAAERTYRVLKVYFNERFELYGRKLRLWVVNLGDFENTTAGRRAAVARADEEFKVFSLSSPEPEVDAEAIRRGLVNFGSYQNPHKWYEDSQPYAFSFFMDREKILPLNAELACKQLAGRNADFGGPDVQGAKRVFGMLAYEGEIHIGAAQEFNKLLQRGCGARIEVTVQFNTHRDGGLSEVGGAITKMRAAGVTSIFCYCDYFSPTYFTREATNQGYFPEWLMMGIGENDRNEIVKLFYDQEQWSHALGVTSLEIARPIDTKDYARAYKEIDPDNSADNGVGRYVWPYLNQVVGAIQMAGPKLTPHTLRDGLMKRWPRRAPQPIWSVGGGYGPGDYTFADYVSLVWWDPDGRNPEDPSNPGAYRHMFDGRRFTIGEIPSDPIPFFEGGITEPKNPYEDSAG